MKIIRSLIICTCTVYHRVDAQKLSRLIAAVREAGIPFRMMDDLCYEAARHPEKLRDTDAIAGCQCRSLQALCAYAGRENPPLVFSVNVDTDEFLRMVSSAPNAPRADETHHPVPDDWIAWYPVIDRSRCIQCGKCADFCMFGVYAIENKRVHVVHPAGCKTDCPACARMCPANAIIFPKSGEVHINGSLAEAVRPDADENASLKARLKNRKAAARLFKEDEG